MRAAFWNAWKRPWSYHEKPHVPSAAAPSLATTRLRKYTPVGSTDPCVPPFDDACCAARSLPAGKRRSGVRMRNG